MYMYMYMYMYVTCDSRSFCALGVEARGGGGDPVRCRPERRSWVREGTSRRPTGASSGLYLSGMPCAALSGGECTLGGLRKEHSAIRCDVADLPVGAGARIAHWGSLLISRQDP